jgi:hypothetical protein
VPRVKKVGGDGIANVQILTVRAVPDGDRGMIDIANSLRSCLNELPK